MIIKVRKHSMDCRVVNFIKFLHTNNIDNLIQNCVLPGISKGTKTQLQIYSEDEFYSSQ